VSYLLVIGLFVLGAALTVLGIWALRDEPPHWMLRIKHPGRVLSLGLVVLVVAVIVNTVRYSFSEDASNAVGSPVSCKKVGVLEIEGEDRKVYACVETQSGHGSIGCYAKVGGNIVEVTEQAERPGAFGGKNPDC
jgi:hypothetical protein